MTVIKITVINTVILLNGHKSWVTFPEPYQSATEPVPSLLDEYRLHNTHHITNKRLVSDVPQGDPMQGKCEGTGKRGESL